MCLFIFKQVCIPYDVCYFILHRCDWSELVVAASADGRFRDLVVNILKRRIHSILLLFMPEDYVPIFWTLMNSSKSCIMGGMVACIMMGSDHSSFYTDSCPLQLDIVVPKNDASSSTAVQVQRMLQAIGYVLVTVQSNPGSFAACTVLIEIYHNAVRHFIWLSTELISVEQILDTSICLLHGRSPSVLNVVLHSPSTAMFKVLTPTFIYDFYPSLTANRIALTVSKYIQYSPTFVYSFGMRSYPVNSPLYRDCVRVCPVRVRCTRGLVGVTKLRWRLINDTEFVTCRNDGFESEDLWWRLSDHCLNHACRYGGRPKFLYDNVS